MQSRVESLIVRCPPGQPLQREFYSDEEIYRLDLDRIWGAGWVFAGHSCEIRNRGQYFTVEVGSDSIIVIRGEGNVLHALHNVCRHRGSLICTETAGQANRLVCPYHQWTYGLDGALLGTRGMQDDLPKDRLGLQQV